MVDGPGIDPTSNIEDEELLYRRVLPDHVDWKSHPPELTSEAFGDRGYRVSVDRAELCGHNPVHTQDGKANYVCCLVTLAIRKIDVVVRRDQNGEVSVKHNIDVEAVPLRDNDAHAEIFGQPHLSNDKVFRRLRHALRERSSWKGGIAP